MKNFKYTWINMGMMLLGKDLETITIEIDEKEFNPIITYKTSNNGEDGIIVVDKTYKLDIKDVLKKLSTIKFPKTNISQDGCDGSAWEVEIDGQVLEGYLDRPVWLGQALKIIYAKEIFQYVERQKTLYLQNKDK